MAAVLLASLIAYLACLRLGQLSPRRRAATKQQTHAQQRRPYQLSDNNGVAALGLTDDALAKDAPATLDVQGARQHSLSYSVSDEEAGGLPVAIGVSVTPVQAVGVARGYDAFA